MLKAKLFKFLVDILIKKILVEVATGIIKRVPWAAVVERAITNVAIVSLRALAAMTTNKVDDGFVDDVVRSLQHKGLRRADEYFDQYQAGAGQARGDGSQTDTVRPGKGPD